MSDLGSRIGEIAKVLAGRGRIGALNKSMSSKTELRFGSHGSFAVDLNKGSWFDHEQNVGGNVVEMLRQYGGVSGSIADWLHENMGMEKSQPATSQTSQKKASKSKGGDLGKIVETYDYSDELDMFQFQVVRFEPKTFRQRRKPRPDDDPKSIKNGWVWSVKGQRLVPYRLVDLIEAVGNGHTICIVEGEKGVNRLWAEGIPATCSPMGAGKWQEEFGSFFEGADVVVIPNQDEPGLEHGKQVCASLKGKAKTVRILNLQGLDEKEDEVEWLEKHGVDALREQIAKAPMWRSEPYKSKFGAVSFGRIDKVDVRHEWIVKHVLPRNSMLEIYGAPQSGKSFFGLHLGLSIARGEDVFGKKTRKGGVIYQAGEGQRGVIDRLKAYRDYYAVQEDEQVPFCVLTRRIDLFNDEPDEFIKEVLALAEYLTEPLELVVIDTLSRAAPGMDENANRDMSKVIENVERIKEACKCSVMIVHHSNADGTKARGHTSLEGAMDTVLKITRDDMGNRTAFVAKQKDGQDGGKFFFRLHSVKIGLDEDEEEITSCVIKPTNKELEPKPDQGAPLGQHAVIAHDCLKKVIALRGQPAPRSLEIARNLPAGIMVVPTSEWRDTFYNELLEDDSDTKQDSRRKAFYRATRALQRRRMILFDKEHDLVWLGGKA